MGRLLTAAAALLIVLAAAGFAWSNSQRGAPAAVTGVLRDADNSGLTATPVRSPTATNSVPSATATLVLRSDPARYLVLFVLDGARPDYYNVPGIPHIKALMRNGADFTNGFAGILESETPSGHATIASGSQPRKDGILSFAWANSDNTTVNLFDPQNILNHQMEDIINAAPAPDISGLVHKSDPKAKVVVLGGHKYYAQDALGGPSADVIGYYTGMPNGSFAPVAVPGHMPPSGLLKAPGLVAKTSQLPAGVEDHMTMRLVLDAFTMMKPMVLMVNVPEFDWPLGHVNGADRDPAQVRELMQGFDQDLGRLEDAYKRAGILNRTLFVLTSDHGFAPIYHTVSNTDIEKAVTSAGTSIISDTFHTAGYIWIQNENLAAQAAAKIARLRNQYIQSVYFREVTPDGGTRYVRATGADLFHTQAAEVANQYLLQTFNGPAGPDIAVFFTENSGSEPGGQASWKGDHGGAAWNSQHLRIIFSGAGVRQGLVSGQPAPLMDIAPTLLTLMGIAPTGMQGVPLASAIRSAPAGLTAASRTQAAQLRPVIDALRAESKAEVAAGK